jgi:uncharacterized membrane protein
MLRRWFMVVGAIELLGAVLLAFVFPLTSWTAQLQFAVLCAAGMSSVASGSIDTPRTGRIKLFHLLGFGYIMLGLTFAFQLVSFTADSGPTRRVRFPRWCCW